jgi:hypothetical protein
MTVAEVLTAAAERAERAPTTVKAVAAGWSGCHADRELIGEVFRQWVHSEDYGGPIPDFGEVLRRRYRKEGPTAIAASLRRAAQA